MKILYINGFEETLKDFSIKFLKENLKDEIVICNWYNKEIKNCIDKEKPDIIVAISIGCLIADSFDIPKILINPVIERKEINKLFLNKDISNLPERVEHYGNIRIIILEKNKKIENEYKNDKIILLNDYNLNNKEVILNEINNLKEFINDLTFIEI